VKKKSLKLLLNRDTLRSLVSPEDLDKIQGGIVSSDNLQCMRDRNKTINPY
jgi:hypothetical protein